MRLAILALSLACLSVLARPTVHGPVHPTPTPATTVNPYRTPIAPPELPRYLFYLPIAGG